MKKINLEVTCKEDCFSYWNSCKRLPNFVNVAALLITEICRCVYCYFKDKEIHRLGR